MDLTEEQRYAAAALFTLSLHSTQVDAGNGRKLINEPYPSGWGEPSPQALDRFYEGHVDHPEFDAPAWDAFWGWDCCGPNGLLDRTYRQLGLPPRTWSGLKKLPEVAYGDSFDEFMELVKTYLAVLDTSLPMPIRKRRRRRKRLQQVLASVSTPDMASSSAPDLRFSGGGGHLIIRGRTDGVSDNFQPQQPIHKLLADEDEEAAEAERPVRDDLFNDILCSDKDSDLEEDLQRAEMMQDFEHHPGGGALLPDDNAMPTPLDMYALLNRKMASQSEPGSRPRTPLANRRVAVSLAVVDGAAVAVQMTVADTQEEGYCSAQSSICTEAPDIAGVFGRGALEPSQKALAAMWELLEGCLGLVNPELEQQVQEAMMQKIDQKLAESEGAGGGASHGANPPATPAPGDEPARNGSLVSSPSGVSDMEKKGLLDVGTPQSQPSSTPGGVAAATTTAVAVAQDPEAGDVAVTMMPRPRWYDARARVALKRLCEWLNVPWSRVQNFEMLLAYQVEKGEKTRPTINVDKWTHSKRWATVAAIAVGGAGAFALVGAVVMMPLFAFALPGVAFFTSAGGMAAVTSTMAALGLADAGSRATRRTQLDVKEFGFMEVVPQDSMTIEEGDEEGEDGEEKGGEERDGSEEKVGGVDADGQHGSGAAMVTAAVETVSIDAMANGTHGDILAESDPGHLMLGATGPPRRPVPPPVQPTTSSSSSGGMMRWFSRKSTMEGDDPSQKLLANGVSSTEDAAPPPEPKPVKAKSKRELEKEEKAREKAMWNKLKKEELLTMPLSKRRSDDLRLSLVIGVNGWIANRADFLRLWKNLRPPDAEVYTLIWESKELIQLNYALTSFLTTQVAQQVAQKSAAMVLGPVVAAVAPAIMLNTASGLLIDNAWAVMVERSIKAGKLLAHSLMTGGHGDRPVVLIGYSMGARVVFHCLLELCRHKCKGIVEHAVMLGMPVGVRAERWRMARSVVSGRFINGFSRRDWMLQVVYRTSKGFTRAAGGLGPVNLPGVENVNLTGLIDGHFAYISNIDEIMELINLWPADIKWTK